METIQGFIHTLSDHVASPAEDIKLGILPEGSMFPRAVKIEDVFRIIKEDLKSTSPKDSTRTVVAVVNSFSSSWNALASKFNVSNSLKDTHREDLIVRSFPQIQMSNPENIKLDYGGKDSIISSFQSDVELGYMLKSLVNTLGEASGETIGHRASRRNNLDQWNKTGNSVTNVDTTDFKHLESTLSLIVRFKEFVDAEQLKSILGGDTSSFLRLVSVMGRLLSNHMMNESTTKHEAFTIKVQTLGIPELDEKFNIGNENSSRKRRFYFKAHDVSRERYSNQEELHWLTGQYSLNQLSHTITPENGYVTDMELIRSAY